jgi:hypothetical protein
MSSESKEPKEPKVCIHLDNSKELLDKIDARFVHLKEDHIMIEATQQEMTDILLILGSEVSDKSDVLYHVSDVEKFSRIKCLDFKFIKIFFEITKCHLTEEFLENMMKQNKEIIDFCIKYYLQQESDDSVQIIMDLVCNMLTFHGKINDHYEILWSQTYEKEFISWINSGLLDIHNIVYYIKDVKLFRYIVDHLNFENKKEVINGDSILQIVSNNKLEFADIIKERINQYPVKANVIFQKENLRSIDKFLCYNLISKESCSYLEDLIEKKIIELPDDTIMSLLRHAAFYDTEYLFDLMTKYYGDTIKKSNKSVKITFKGCFREKYKKKLDAFSQ